MATSTVSLKVAKAYMHTMKNLSFMRVRETADATQVVTSAGDVMLSLPRNSQFAKVNTVSFKAWAAQLSHAPLTGV